MARRAPVTTPAQALRTQWPVRCGRNLDASWRAAKRVRCAGALVQTEAVYRETDEGAIVLATAARWHTWCPNCCIHDNNTPIEDAPGWVRCSDCGDEFPNG